MLIDNYLILTFLLVHRYKVELSC